MDKSIQRKVVVRGSDAAERWRRAGHETRKFLPEEHRAAVVDCAGGGLAVSMEEKSIGLQVRRKE